MIMLKKVITFLLVLTSSGFAFSQPDTLLVNPGNSLIDGSIIEDYTNKWKVTYISGDGKKVPNKIWTDYGQVMTLGEKDYFHRVQDLYDPQMNLLDTWINMVEHKTLTPVSSSTLKPSGLFSHVKYEGTVAILRTNTTSKDTTTLETQTDFGQQVFDWSLYGMLLVGLPMEEGLIAKLPIVGKASIGWLVVHVAGKEALTLPEGREITTWKVVTNQRLTFWMSKSAPYVIKLKLDLPEGAQLLWEMI